MTAIRKIIAQIPNTITSLNLLSGTFSIILAFSGELKLAVLWIIIASIFDFCDGLAARLLRAYSDNGKELDSLADVISFGLAPSIILYNYMLDIESVNIYLCYIPLLITVFSALRLAKFNIDTRQSENFIGLPTPAAALIIGSLIYFAIENGGWIASSLNNSYAIPTLSIIISALLISEIHMFSMKFKSLKWGQNKIRYIYLICLIPLGVLCLIFSINWSGLVLGAFLLYITFSISTASICPNIVSKS